MKRHDFALHASIPIFFALVGILAALILIDVAVFYPSPEGINDARYALALACGVLSALHILAIFRRV